MTFVTWALFAASLTGVVLNIRHHAACFLVWLFTGLSWATYAAWTQPPGWTGLCVREVTFAGFAVWGWWSWRRKAR